MTIFQAAVLGLIQGITEFVPVSSSGHLLIAPAVFGWPDAGAAYTAVLQLGTLLAVVGFFMRDLLAMIGAALDPARRRSPEARRLLYLIVGTVPIGLAGVALKHVVEGPLRSLVVVATAMIVVALLMALVEWRASHRRPLDDLTLRDALWIGLSQTLALIPGVSRSGSTIACGMAVGLQRDAAARFSFLLSVPAVSAAALYELPKVLRSPGQLGMPLLVALVVAAVSGYLSIGWLLRFVRTRTTYPFVLYRLIVGAALLIAIATGHL